jgi:hypothetical protein
MTTNVSMSSNAGLATRSVPTSPALPLNSRRPFRALDETCCDLDSIFEPWSVHLEVRLDGTPLTRMPMGLAVGAVTTAGRPHLVFRYRMPAQDVSGPLAALSVPHAGGVSHEIP